MMSCDEAEDPPGSAISPNRKTQQMTKCDLFASSGIRSGRIVALLCMMLCLLPGALFGAGKPRKVVRIPYTAFERQMVVDENNRPVSGYAYDYIQTIATYAGWKIEYIPCDNFEDCLKKLEAGEVDVFYDVRRTGEREKKILFPDEPMGYEYYYLYTSNKNESISSGDPSSLNGKIVGVTSGTTLVDHLKRWCKKKNIKLDIREYKTIPQKEADLFAGKIDLDMELSMLAKGDISAVEKVGSAPYYLAVSKTRPDLLEDINNATEKVLNNDLYYFSRLQERYFSETVLSRNLTAEEKAWLAEHQVLRVGYLDNYLPFCAKDKKGKPIGAAIEAVNEIVKRLKLEDHLRVEFICFTDQKKGFQALESGRIDIMIPAYISNSVKKDYRIIGGKILATIPCDLVYLNGFGDDGGKRIGVNRHNLMQYYYTRDSYPNAEIVFHDDINSCLDGVLKDKSDGTLLNGLRTATLLKPSRYQPLQSVRVKNDFHLHMAFAEDNIGLMLLMDRGLTMLGPDFIDKASYPYMVRSNQFSLLDYLLEHILPVMITVAIMVALIVALIVYILGNRKLSGINRELKEYSEIIDRQRFKELDLRRQLEKKQSELKDALNMAQAASRAKTTFLSNMSHDIRTPMNAIVGFTGLAASHIDDRERVRDYLATIAQSSEHLLALINDVLDMSRIESGKMTLSEKPESLAEILHALRDIVQADLQAKHHTFFIDTTNIRDEFVYCDKMRLNQVLLNLVSNAIKYTPPGGTISLLIAQKPTKKSGRGSFEIRCRDNGIGMSEEFVRTIFEPFTRETTSTVSGIQGTGLGMAITKNIVEMMGGRVSVTSKQGEGTEFVVLLEFRLAENKTAETKIPELNELRSLVVDDDETACRSTVEMLRDIGMRGEWCVSGEEAIDRAEEAIRQGDRFKVYIVDWHMPGMSGLETVRGIRKLAGEDAYILILTAYDWVDIENEAKEVGVSGFVPKPLFPSDLRKALAQACGKAIPDRPDRKAPSVSFAGKKILMVDDSKLNLKVGVLLLQEQGMIVDTAANGQIAVDMIREKGVDAYDFILMDVQMPVMNGYEATAVLRKLPGGEKLKIVAFSANAFEEDREKSLKAGMNGHISKPLKIEELLKELNRFSA